MLELTFLVLVWCCFALCFTLQQQLIFFVFFPSVTAAGAFFFQQASPLCLQSCDILLGFDNILLILFTLHCVFLPFVLYTYIYFFTFHSSSLVLEIPSPLFLSFVLQCSSCLTNFSASNTLPPLSNNTKAQTVPVLLCRLSLSCTIKRINLLELSTTPSNITTTTTFNVLLLRNTTKSRGKVRQRLAIHHWAHKKFVIR